MRSLCLFVDTENHFTDSLMIILRNIEVPISFTIGPSANKYAKYFSDCMACNVDELVNRLTVKGDKEETSYIGLNCGISYIIGKEILDRIPTLNIHPSALPLNRGSHQSFWEIMNNECHGATLHWMLEGLDSGPILAQKIYDNDEISVASKVQDKSAELCLDLVKENIVEILMADVLPKGIPQNRGTSHKKKEIHKAACIEEDELISGKKVLQLARATCSKGNGFYITSNGKLIGRIIVSNIDSEW